MKCPCMLVYPVGAGVESMGLKTMLVVAWGGLVSYSCWGSYCLGIISVAGAIGSWSEGTSIALAEKTYWSSFGIGGLGWIWLEFLIRDLIWAIWCTILPCPWASTGSICSCTLPSTSRSSSRWKRPWVPPQTAKCLGSITYQLFNSW
jgi:hypothetical protein